MWSPKSLPLLLALGLAACGQSEPPPSPEAPAAPVEVDCEAMANNMAARRAAAGLPEMNGADTHRIAEGCEAVQGTPAWAEHEEAARCAMTAVSHQAVVDCELGPMMVSFLGTGAG